MYPKGACCFSCVGGNHAEEIVQPPESLSELRLGENPATADAAQPVDLGQAAGHQNIVGQAKRGVGRAVERGIKVDFVYEQLRTDAGRQSSRAPDGFR